MSGIFGSLDSSLDPEQINVQINNLDSYSCFPTILDTKASKSLPGIPFAQVPVLRFYGCLSTGHKVLIHCHGILPYIFIKYDGQMNESASAMRNRCSKLHNILETRMVVTYTKEEVKDKLKVLKYVANVSVVKGIPFYGYHVGYELYYKITLLNDAYCNKLSELLRDGKVFTSKTDAFEAHIPYILQMMADYNLFGCGWLKLSRCYFRQPFLLTDLDMNEILHTDSLKEFLEKQLKRNENVLDEDPFHRVGKTFLEIDILPQFIMNREEIQFRDLHHDFIELKSELQASDQGYVNSTKDIWKEIEAIRKTKHLKKYEGLREVFRESQMQYNWKEDERLVRYFDEAKVRTSSIFPKENLNFDTFVETSNNGHLIMKCREAIKELWPKIPRHVSRKVCLWSEMVPSTNKENIFNKRESKDLATTSNIPALMNLSFEEAKTSSGSSKRKESSDFDQTSHETNRRKVFKLRKATILKSAYPAIKKPSITYENMKERLAMNQIDEVQYNEPFFSNPLDCKKLQTEIAGSLFKLSSNHISFRKALSHNSKTPVLPESEEVYQRIRWKYIKPKPSFQKVANFTESFRERFSMVAGKTPDLTYGYKFKSNKMHLKKNNAFNRMTHFTMELHVNTKEGMFPDPKSDSVRMIFWKIQDGTFPFDLDITQEGVLVFLEDVSQENSWKTADPSLHVTPYYDELEMIYALEDLVRFFDPDILSGYEIHSSSWGYLIDRCHNAHKYDVEEELSRVDNVQSKKKRDKWGYTHATAFSITGRQMLNIWRPLRSSLNLLDYTLENIAFHVLHQRLPFFSYETRTKLFESSDIVSKRCLLAYWVTRLRVNFELLETQNIIGKTIEQARLIGIDFYSVFYRGSQYKVESFLIRLCKSEEFILVSPSRLQVRNQKALECIPLVMEPSSAFYKSPLIVLDFQSLYPSIVMAYNYCYSTIIGRVQTLKLNDNEIGATKHDIPYDLLELISDYVNISPNGVVFVKKELRKSILAKMLKDILDTRFLMKDTLNALSEEHELINMLDNRQGVLKLLANVTYGYTSASFSGRMPCSDIADSIVQTGRETLERAIDIIESTKKWGAKVVYGDTDSLFVYLPGKSKHDAFVIGRQIAEEITKQNPKPVELKFEKVYHPCFLVTKKRYVGYSYESEQQKIPKFDAKGIETVRRDGTPAQQKIVEKALRIMFETTDLSKVKKYVVGEFDKIITGRVNIQDFCFAREVKLGHYKSDKTAPPGAKIAMQMMEEDSRTEPQYKQRVPYVVKMGKMGETLTSRCLSPEAFLRSKTSRLDYTYYIVKNIVPPLQRFFQLVGVDVMEWYTSMPHTFNMLNENLGESKHKGKSLTSIVKGQSCLRCRKRVHPKSISRVCDDCKLDKSNTALFLLESIRLKESKMHSVLKTCQTCSYKFHKDAMIPPNQIALKCQSKDCPVYFSKFKYMNGLKDNDMRDLLVSTIDLDY